MKIPFILLLCFLCFLAYFNRLNNGFILDDEFLIVNNPLIKSSKFLMSVFKSSPGDYYILSQSYNKMYRPLQTLTYSIEYKIWKLNALGYHFTNILLHLFNSILIYYLLLIIFNNSTLSKIASIFFLIHPIHISVVSYVASRADLLVSFFILLSLLSFLKFISQRSHKYYILSLLFAVLALLSRENAMSLFIYIALVLFIIKSKLKDYSYVIPFVLLNLLYFLLRFIVFGQNAIAIHPLLLTLPLRLINFFNIVPRYLLILLFPLDLHMMRTTPFILQMLDSKTILAITSFIFFVIVVIKFRNNKLLIFSIFWFFIGILPIFLYMDGYVMLGEAMMAESWIYLSSVGFFNLFFVIKKRWARLSNMLILFMTIFFTFLTFINNNYWRNNIIFYENILEHSIARNYIRKNLISEYIQIGLFEKALVEIKKLSVYYPEDKDLFLLHGHYYYSTKRIPMAIEKYNMVLKKNEDFCAYYSLSLCYEKLGQLDDAIGYALKAVNMNPYYKLALIKLGDLYKKKTQILLTKRYYQKALEIDPDDKILKEKIRNAE